ncbi:hypothetical protein [Clostridium cochlearium]|uniref:Uncharacterized protein n=1 Tax=Clostridium cochlearium TaxID=1494 RepID=A0A7Y3V7C4_CLOCO|nr:hypothetical protein [Clostridium cochlearium]NOH16059.1 hypothetical protein [Clostridium cochlearium]
MINNKKNCNLIWGQGKTIVKPCDTCKSIKVNVDAPLPPPVKCSINIELILIIIILLIIIKKSCCSECCYYNEC